MYPVLFEFSIIKAHSYYVLWAFALLVFIVWTRKRAVTRYGMPWDGVTSVIVWVYFAAIIGAIAGGAAEKIPLIISGREGLGALAKGGMTSGAGLLAGGIAGLWRLRALGLSADDFAESASLPGAMMLGIGRIGCFMEGCCLGVGRVCAARPWWGVHFPQDAANFFRYPSQMSESIAAFIIAAILYLLEKRMESRDARPKGAILFPLFLILYGVYRFAFDFLRAARPQAAFNLTHVISALAIATGAAWLWRTVVKRL